jgi:hypothetical protein
MAQRITPPMAAPTGILTAIGVVEPCRRAAAFVDTRTMPAVFYYIHCFDISLIYIPLYTLPHSPFSF